MPSKLKPYEFFETVLGSPKYVVAPMVDASELAWRMLGRRYGADLCYTPMWHSAVFVRDAKYRQDALQTCPKDRPLIIQFCANNPDTFRKAVELTLAATHVDAVDLNIGCPQVIARRGHFGSYLQDEWELLTSLIRIIHDNFEVPITAKLRVFDDVDKTVRYAQMLEAAGAQILTVHGRTRDQKGALTGLASWDHIKAVKAAVHVPVIANGNIQFKGDADRCMAETGVDGVMVAEGHLTNPALFADLHPPVWDMCLEYLDLVGTYPCPLSYSRGHMFKLLHHVLQIKDNFDVRQIIAKGSSLGEFREAVITLKDKYLPYHTGEKAWECPEELQVFKLSFHPWLCQPYVRPPPEEHLKKMKEIEERAEVPKRPPSLVLDQDGNPISRKKQKKMERNPFKNFTHAREQCVLCQSCHNPAGTKCGYGLCRKCCREKCFVEDLDCPGHRIQVQSKRAAARRHQAAESNPVVDVVKEAE
eukprot:maker-scaffold1588_size34843-snap-gene-0.15 protein:Tk02930 transcript:maker-scaffold1588_size34843-snap-gene-0.15-mRNA-1 annotation:"GF22874"